MVAFHYFPPWPNVEGSPLPWQCRDRERVLELVGGRWRCVECSGRERRAGGDLVPLYTREGQFHGEPCPWGTWVGTKRTLGKGEVQRGVRCP